MTHFVGMVVARDEAHMHQLLERYNENREVEPYVDDTDWIEALSKCANYSVTKGDNIGDKTVLQLLNEWSGSGWRFNRDEQRFEHFTTYNPESLWDWYVIGGRWDGHYHRENKVTVEAAIRALGIEGGTLYGNVPPRVLVDSNGILKRGREGWFGYTENEYPDEEWGAMVGERLDRSAPDAFVYFLDLHI